jgi:hypothetical protein
MASKVYFDPGHVASFSTLDKLSKGLKDEKRSDVKSWLEEQDAYTLHRPVRKRFPRNPYTVSNVMNVWECDLLDMQAHSKVNDNFRYLLTVIDVFSKFIHVESTKSKDGPSGHLRFSIVIQRPKIFSKTSSLGAN